MLEARQFCCSYGLGPILQEIDLNIVPGERVALVGPNGSGKSTLLRCLSGLTSGLTTKGSVLLDGRLLQDFSRRDLASQLSLVSQSLEVAFPITAWDYVAMGCYHRLDRLGFHQQDQEEVIESALRSTATIDLASRSVQNVSGGEWQRLRIAQALAQRTRYLLLDEPTAHLDIKVQLELMDLLVDLAESQEVTPIFSLHDLGLALRYSQRCLILSQGRLVADGPSDQVLTQALLGPTFGVNFEKVERPGWIYPICLEKTEGPLAI